MNSECECSQPGVRLACENCKMLYCPQCVYAFSTSWDDTVSCRRCLRIQLTEDPAKSRPPGCGLLYAEAWLEKSKESLSGLFCTVLA